MIGTPTLTRDLPVDSSGWRQCPECKTEGRTTKYPTVQAMARHRKVHGVQGAGRAPSKKARVGDQGPTPTAAGASSTPATPTAAGASSTPATPTAAGASSTPANHSVIWTADEKRLVWEEVVKIVGCNLGEDIYFLFRMASANVLPPHRQKKAHRLDAMYGEDWKKKLNEDASKLAAAELKKVAIPIEPTLVPVIQEVHDDPLEVLSKLPTSALVVQTIQRFAESIDEIKQLLVDIAAKPAPPKPAWSAEPPKVWSPEPPKSKKPVEPPPKHRVGVMLPFKSQFDELVSIMGDGIRGRL